jgi:hypothetical protein
MLAGAHTATFVTGRTRDFDLIRATRHVNMEVNATFHHIKGHQDKKKILWSY